MAIKAMGGSVELSWSDPGFHAASITPNDNADLATQCRAIYVGAVGNVAVIMAGGESVTFNSVPAGTILPIVCNRVMSTGTTATQLVAIW